MKNEELITVETCCMQYNIEVAFVHSLFSAGLIHPVTVEEVDYLQQENIPELEKMIRLHYEMEVNIEGIEVIAHLLKRVDALQEEIKTLRNKLSLYEY